MQVIRMAYQPPPFMLTLWNPRGIVAAWQAAQPQLLRLNPGQRRFAGGLILHSTAADLVKNASALSIQIRTLLATAWARDGSQPCPIWLEIAGDAGSGTPAQLLSARLDVVHTAKTMKVPVVILDMEARWKHHEPGFDHDAAAQLLTEAHRQCPEVVIAYTGQDQPTLHGEMPLRGFSGVDFWAPELYAYRPVTMFDEHDRHVRSWSEARAQARVTGAPVFPYALAGSVPCVETSWLRDAYETILLWVAGCTKDDDAGALDAEGERLISGLSALAVLGYIGTGCVSRFQWDRGLSVSGKLDVATLAALGVV